MTFSPDPGVMLRQSVLSSVTEDRRAFLRGLSATDRARMDQYFTSVRELEQQLSMQLEKRAPAKACARMNSPVKGIQGPISTQWFITTT